MSPLSVSSAPDYAPFRPGPFQLSMGLAPLDPRDWIEPDEHLASELREKARLLHERHHEVFAAFPAAAAGSAEVLALLVDYLPSRFPTLYRRVGARLDHLVTGQSWHLGAATLHPLDLAGRLVQEDLCLMHCPQGADTYHLVGASVCFPTRWRLADKMGKSVGTIHAPVPGYAEQLATPMDRVFHRLKTERPVWRLNWGLTDNPALFQPTGHGRLEYNARITPQNAGEMLWLRMERQTLRRLPGSGDVLFTIRVHIRPLHTLAAHPQRAAALAAAVRAFPQAMQQYKSLPPFLDALLVWLDRVASTTG
jgi:Haem-dependent oxidative N-demethylase, alpha subunit-like